MVHWSETTIIGNSIQWASAGKLSLFVQSMKALELRLQDISENFWETKVAWLLYQGALHYRYSPPRLGRLGFPIMVDVADTEYSYSQAATNELKEAIVQQQSEYQFRGSGYGKTSWNQDGDNKGSHCDHHSRRYKDTKKGLLAKLPEQGQLMLE